MKEGNKANLIVVEGVNTEGVSNGEKEMKWRVK